MIMKLKVLISGSLVGIILLTGCAISYQNGDRRGLLGLAWIEYRAHDTGKSATTIKIGKETLGQVTPVIQQKSLGLYLDVSRNSPGAGLGYRDVIVVVPEVDAETVVDYDTSDPLSASLKVKKHSR